MKRTAINQAYVFLSPYLFLFGMFIVIPVLVAAGLSLTYFNTVEMPEWTGFKNYVDLFTHDEIFMQHVLPNTLKFALIVGPGGYIISFLLAWMLAQIPHKPRTVLALIIYSPSMTMGVAMSVVWKILFSGDQTGYLNAVLLEFGWIQAPIQWLQSPDYLMTIMIIVSLWSSMGVGFLAMLAGVLNIDQSMYEAGYIDGIKNRFQEIIYITIPSMKPQMLFSAVMAIVGTLKAGEISSLLTGMTVTPNYAGHLISNHIEDYAFLRYEWGYASALSVFLLLLGYGLMRLSYALFRTKGDE